MTREELLRALVVERFATVTPPPPSRRGPDLDGWADHDPDAGAEPNPEGSSCDCGNSAMECEE